MIHSILKMAQAAPFKATAAGTGIILERVCAFTFGTCTLIGGFHESVKALLLLMLLDLVTGLMASRKKGTRVTSRRFGEGAVRKFVMLMVVAAANLLDGVFGTAGVIFTGAAWWFIATEAISLYENAEALEVPMPSGLRKLLEAILQKADKSLGSLVGDGPLHPPAPVVTKEGTDGAA